MLARESGIHAFGAQRRAHTVGCCSTGCGSVVNRLAARCSRVGVAQPFPRPSKAAVFTVRGTSTLPIAHSNRAQTPTQKMDGRGAVGGAPDCPSGHEWT